MSEESVQLVVTNCPEMLGEMIGSRSGYAMVNWRPLSAASAEAWLQRKRKSGEYVVESGTGECRGYSLSDVYRLGLVCYVVRKCRVAVRGTMELSDEAIDRVAALMIDSYFEQRNCA